MQGGHGQKPPVTPVLNPYAGGGMGGGKGGDLMMDNVLQDYIYQKKCLNCLVATGLICGALGLM